MQAGRGPSGRSVREVLGLRDTPVRVTHTPQKAARRGTYNTAGAMLQGLTHVRRSGGDGDGNSDAHEDEDGTGLNAAVCGGEDGLLVSNKSSKVLGGVSLYRDDVDYR